MKTECSFPTRFSLTSAIFFLLAIFSANAPLSQASLPVTVGVKGNEPIVAAAPDGTLYISALQHIYRSTDSGANWTKLAGPIYASTLNLASDSSISVDPGNRLYFTFDYPYAGTTAVCTSDDHGDTFNCNPGVVPGGTDRMWITAPSITRAFEVTNQGLYETAFLTSTDRGNTFVPKSVGSGILEPQTGPLFQQNCSTKVLQTIKVYGNSPEEEEVKIYVYNPESMGALISDIYSTGLKLPTALPSGSLGRDGAFYIASEEANAAGGRQAVVARSFNGGATWTKLPPIPATTTGTATFTWVAAGAPGHVGVLYYYTTENGNPGTLTTATWSAVFAESYNADTRAPSWTVTTVEPTIHIGPICVAADCMGTNRFAGDFINAIIDSLGAAHLTWMKQENGTGASSIRYQRIQSAPVSNYVPPPCGLTVASRKNHGGGSNSYDVPLPFLGTHGVECRAGGANGNHTLVFTFVNTLNSVGGASLTSGTGTVTNSSIGADAHEYIVELSGVANAQTVTVSLANAAESNGTSTSLISASMDVLLGDTNGDGAVNSGDTQQTRSRSGQPASSANFRSDVNLDANVNSGDAVIVRANSGTALPAAETRSSRE